MEVNHHSGFAGSPMQKKNRQHESKDDQITASEKRMFWRRRNLGNKGIQQWLRKVSQEILCEEWETSKSK